jgi:arylsulfatase
VLAAPDPPCNALRWNEPPRRRNVVLIVSDTMRRDRIGIYGGPARTPTFDRFARGNIYFTQAYAQAPWTKPSIATLFTGLYPSQHRVSTDPALPDQVGPGYVRGPKKIIETDVLSPEFVTLAEVMRDAGYRTAAFVSNPWLKRPFGFDQGFEVYRDEFANTDMPGQSLTRHALGWLRGLTGDEHYFLYLHYMDSHNPYGRLTRSEVQERAEEIAADRRPLVPEATAHSMITRVARYEDGDRVVESGIPPTRALLELIYDRGVENFNHTLGSILYTTAVKGGSEDTAVIVTSDHGEALFTRGWNDHGHGFFDDELALPLAGRLPGTSARNPVECPVGLIDVLATLCVYLGLECPEEKNFGTSFLAPHPGRWSFGRGSDDREPRYLVSEGVVRKPRHRLIRNRHFKLMFEPGGRRSHGASNSGYSLFAVAGEDAEDRDLLSPEHLRPEFEAVFSRLASALEWAVPSVEAPEPESVPLDEETQRRLEALGYLE